MTEGTSDEQRLRGYVDVWWQAIDDFARLLEKVDAEAWSTPTDLPGWDVHAVVAHVAHLEGTLTGVPHDQVDIGEPPHVRGMMGTFTEQGVVARRDRTPDELINELRANATRRHTHLLAEAPTDATATADQWAGMMGWTWERLLRNRPLDVWMHEQDVRRAVGMPGGMDSPAARHTADYLTESLGMVVGKRVAPPAGTTVVLEVEGSPVRAVAVGDDGKALPVEPPAEPTVRIGMDRESFIVAAGGRRTPEAVRIEGDRALGERVVAALGVTP
jgi:uncharacterized protein (TIGR03083 family)